MWYDVVDEGPQRPHRQLADSLHTTAATAALLSLAAHVAERLKAEWQIPTSSREIESWLCEWIALNRTPDGAPATSHGKAQQTPAKQTHAFTTAIAASPHTTNSTKAIAPEGRKHAASTVKTLGSSRYETERKDLQRQMPERGVQKSGRKTIV